MKTARAADPESSVTGAGCAPEDALSDASRCWT